MSTSLVPRRARFTPAVRLTLILLLTLAAVAIFMTWNSRGNWDFVLAFRGRKVWAMALVSSCVAVSTVIFQTVTNNRILTPSIMGFDALYMLVQTLVVFFIGSIGLATTDPRIIFMVNVVLMTLFANLLYVWLFVRARRSLHVVVLVGIIFGTLFRSVTNLLQRMIDPTDFAVVQDANFASFNSVNQELLGLSTVLALVIVLIVALRHHVLDALSLGRAVAINLGVDYRREVLILLSCATGLVSIATSLVGPVAFLGLLVAHLAYMTVGTPRHWATLIGAALFGMVCVVAGQFVIEHVLNFTTSISVMIDFVGGLLFLALLIRSASR